MRIGGCGLLAAGSELFRWFRLKVLWMLLCVLPSQGRSWVCSRCGRIRNGLMCSTTSRPPLSPVVATLEELAVWCFIDSKRSESWLHGVKILQEDATLRDLDLDDWRSHVRGEWNEWYRRARTFAPYAHLKHPPGLELK